MASPATKLWNPGVVVAVIVASVSIATGTARVTKRPDSSTVPAVRPDATESYAAVDFSPLG